MPEQKNADQLEMGGNENPIDICIRKWRREAYRFLPDQFV